MGRVSKWLSTGTQASLIAFAAIWGTLAREGLNAVGSFDGQPLAEPILWAQAVGCLIMGWAAANKGMLDRPRAVKLTASGTDLFGNGAVRGKTLPTLGLHVALSTGFCGSVTTFSTWILQDFLAFSNHGLYHRSGFFSFVDGITQLCLTPVVSLMCLRIGMLSGRTWLSLSNILAFMNGPRGHLRQIMHLDPIPPLNLQAQAPCRERAQDGAQPERLLDAPTGTPRHTDEAANEASSPTRHVASEPSQNADDVESAGKDVPSSSDTPSAVTAVSSWWARTTTIVALLIGPAFWIGSALLLALYDRPQWRHITWALLFAPLGAWTRWQLAVWCNPLPPPADESFGDDAPRRPWNRNTFRLWRHKVAWPMGTLVANVLATAVLAGVYTAQHVDPRAPPARTKEMAHQSAAWDSPASSFSLGCGALYGVQEGFCACLSTISTFAVELDTVRPRRKAALYAFASYTLAMLFCILLVGAPTWGFDSQGKTAYGPSRCPSLKY